MDVSWLPIALIICATFGAAWVGRLLCNRWFNPLSLYSGLWGFCLCSYELRLIQYEPVSNTAWVYILIAWIFLYLGGMTAWLAGHAKDQSPELSIDLIRLKKAIIWLSIIAGVGLVDQIRVVAHTFGNPLYAIFINAGDIYLGRVGGSLSWVPYVGAISYAACCLSGAYTAKIGKPTLVGALPIILVALSNVFAMVRAGVVMAAFLFLVSFSYSPRQNSFKLERWQRFFGMSVAVIILVGGFVFVSATRKLGVQFAGMTPAIDSVSEYIPVFPSIYSNFSAPPVAFSMYLDSPAETRENSPWGQYTFAPISHLFSKLGFSTEAGGEGRFEENYYTPVPMNTATYLKNVISDFGFSGAFIFPFFLGAVVTYLVLKLASHPRLFHLMLLSNLFLVIAFSFVVNLMALGDWYISAAVSVLVALLVQPRSEHAVSRIQTVAF